MNSSVSPADRFYIITGGPGSGKTTLIEALKERGYSASVEAGRAIIQDQLSQGGQALPWMDRQAFAALMLEWDIRSYQWAQTRKDAIFFDRGIPDVVGYLRLVQLPVPPAMEEAVRIYRYHPHVFIAEPWAEIYVQDKERKQDFQEAIATYHMLAGTYQQLGYQLITLPQAPVEERVEFVLRHIQSGVEE